MYPANLHNIRPAASAEARVMQRAVLTQVLRMRAAALTAYQRTPSLPERIRAMMAPFRAAHVTQS
jgi:hypothetical protein